MAQKTEAKKADPPAVDAELARRLLADMMLIRRFEEKAAEAYVLGKIGGFLHLSIGEEAVAAGATSVLRRDDYAISTYREHGHCLAKGCDPRRAMAEQLGHGPAWIAALGQAVTVLAIGRDRIVIASQHRRGAGGDGFLTDREVEESADLAQGVRFSRCLLVAADQHHVGKQAAGQLGIDGRRAGLLRFGLLRHVSSYRPPTIASRSARPPIAAGGPGRSRR